MHLADAFIQRDLQCIQSIQLFLFGQYVFFQHKLSESKLLKGNVSIYKMATVSVFFNSTEPAMNY